MGRHRAVVLVAVACLSSVQGCAGLMAPAMGGPCRDPSTGRFISCGGSGSGSGGGDSDTALITLGVAAGVAAIGGLIYLLTRAPDPPPDPRDTRACIDDSGQTVTVSASQSCERMGYRAAGSAATVAAGPTHRCRHANGDEADFAADQPCAAAGYADVASGPRVLRCYERGGRLVPATAATCEAVGLLSVAP